MDKAGVGYWDKNWESKQYTEIFDINSKDINDYINVELHKWLNNILRKFISEKDRTDLNILEIGCAKSIWLPYFYKEYGLNIVGLDYSSIGCKLTEKTLEILGIPGKIYCSDLFKPLPQLEQSFDVVFSMGVIEHFDNTNECLNAMSKYLKPGGLLISIIPNMKGITGLLQKIINIKTYNSHVPLSKNQLVNAFDLNIYDKVKGDYFLFINFNVINIENLRNTIFYIPLLKLIFRASKVFWIIDRKQFLLKSNSLTSPYIVSTAIKK